eukprot:99285_1
MRAIAFCACMWLYRCVTSSCSYGLSLSRDIIPAGQCMKYTSQNYSYMLFCDEFWMKTITWKSNSDCSGQNDTVIGKKTALQSTCTDTFNKDCQILYVDRYEDNFEHHYDGYDYWGDYFGNCSVKKDGPILMQLPYIVNQCLPAPTINTSQIWFYDGSNLRLYTWKNTNCFGYPYEEWLLTCDGYTIDWDSHYPQIQPEKFRTSWIDYLFLPGSIIICTLFFFIMCYLIYRCFRNFREKQQYKALQYKLQNPLVAVIGIAEYDNLPGNNEHLEQLNGVTMDTTELITLWESVYGYDTYCFNNNKMHNKYKCSKKEFNTFFDDIVNKLQNTDEYDGFILCLSCHGGEDMITSSDRQSIYIMDIIRRIHVVTEKRNIPTILIIDACRGDRQIRITESVKSKLKIEIHSKNKNLLNPDFIRSESIENSVLMKYVNFLILWSTTEGAVAQQIEDGSYFTKSLCVILRKSKSIRRDLKKLLQAEINKELMKRSGNSQLSELQSSVVGGICLDKPYDKNKCCF